MEQFKTKAIQQRFDRIAQAYAQHESLSADIADRLLSRLSFIKLLPSQILDLGAGTGVLSKKLQAQYPLARIQGLDISAKMLEVYLYEPIHGIAEALPFEDNSLDLVASNLLLPWCNDLSVVFSEVSRVLKPEGVFIFSTFGPDTFCELREAWASIDETAHVHVNLDMHDVGDVLLKTGFLDPVMDVESLRLHYKTFEGLCKEIRALGMSNLRYDRALGLLGREKFSRFKALLVERYRCELSLELVFGCAIKTEQKDQPQNEFSFSLEALRRTLRRGE